MFGLKVASGIGRRLGLELAVGRKGSLHGSRVVASLLGLWLKLEARGERLWSPLLYKELKVAALE